MPRQTKEPKEVIELEEKDKKKMVKAAKKDSKKAGTEAGATKKSATKKTSKKADTEAGATKKSDTKKTSKKADTEASSTKKSVTKKTSKKANTEDGSTKKSATKKTSKKSDTKVGNSKKSANKKTSSKSVKNEIIEYYDLPYRYNKTTVKILAQTPKKLFVYWDISDKDRKNFIETYGDNFFEVTKPVLIIKNTTMNYSFEVDINDFANSWYLNINDSDCKYSIELGRRPIEYNPNINADYIYVSSSNNIEAPNDHILFEDSQNMVYFRNVKTNVTTARNLTSLSFITNMGRIYNIYDLYKKIYADEELDEINNPSSSFFK